MTREPDEAFDEKVKVINKLYRQAPELAEKGERVLSTACSAHTDPVRSVLGATVPTK